MTIATTPATPGAEPPACRITGASLSARLRKETVLQHEQVEQQLGLPESITGLAEYGSLIERFFHLYRPLELLLGRFGEWSQAGIDLAERVHTPALAADLKALGIATSRIPDASGDRLPALPSFPHALGALYVMEGSTLGSQYILPRIAEVLGAKILGADAFFRGYGAHTHSFWKRLQAALDRFGVEEDERIPDVVAGAQATFEAMGSWLRR